jgi:TNF receptor-associated protein 1
LLFIPESHEEHLGMGRIEPGVSLYSRKVLIQGKSKSLLPEWLRFVKGTVSSSFSNSSLFILDKVLLTLRIFH